MPLCKGQQNCITGRIIEEDSPPLFGHRKTCLGRPVENSLAVPCLTFDRKVPQAQPALMMLRNSRASPDVECDVMVVSACRGKDRLAGDFEGFVEADDAAVESFTGVQVTHVKMDVAHAGVGGKGLDGM